MNAASAAGVTLFRILGSLITGNESRDYTRQCTLSQFEEVATRRHVLVAQALLPLWVLPRLRQVRRQDCLHFKSEISNLKLTPVCPETS